MCGDINLLQFNFDIGYMSVFPVAESSLVTSKMGVSRCGVVTPSAAPVVYEKRCSPLSFFFDTRGQRSRWKLHWFTIDTRWLVQYWRMQCMDGCCKKLEAVTFDKGN